MKRFRWLFLGLFIVIIGGGVYFKQKYNAQNRVEDRFIYNQATQKWEEYGGKDVVGNDRGSDIEE